MIAFFREKKLFSSFLLLLLATLLFFACLDVVSLYKQTFFFIFQSRDIERAKNFLNGHFIFFGPEMTGGGYLPGPLYYLILSAAFFIKSGWKSAWLAQLFFCFSTAIIGFQFFYKRFSSVTMGLLWILLFSLAPFTFRFLQLFLNVSPMLFFVFGSIIMLVQSHQSNTYRDRKKYLSICCFLIGLGIQLHFSIIFLFLAVITLQFFAQRFGLQGLKTKDFFISCFWFILPMIPFFIWLTLVKIGLTQSETTIANAKGADAFKSVPYIAKFSLDGPRSLLFETWFKNFFFAIPFPLFFILIARLIEKNKPTTRRNLFVPLYICLAFAFIPFIDWFFSPQAMRYTMPFYAIVILLTLLYFKETLESPLQLKTFNFTGGFCATLSFIAFGNYIDYFEKKFFLLIFLSTVLAIVAVPIFIKQKTSPKKVFGLIIFVALAFNQKLISNAGLLTIQKSVTMPSQSHWEHYWKIISSRTGWSYSEAQKRIYYINHHMEQDPRIILGEMEPSIEKLTAPGPLPHGFFISSMYLQSGNTRLVDPKEWIINQNIQSEVKKGINNGWIKLGKNLSKKYLVVPYWVLNQEKMPPYFHNVGEGYELSADDLALQKITKDGTAKLSENEFLFKWNESSDMHPFCSTGAIVKILKKEKGALINVKIVGGALSQVSPWVSPGWTQAWLSPYIKVKCATETKLFEIASSVGFNRLYSNDPTTPVLLGNNSFIGPFERSFDMNCGTKIEKISIGRRGSSVDKIRSVSSLRPTELTVDL